MSWWHSGHLAPSFSNSSLHCDYGLFFLRSSTCLCRVWIHFDLNSALCILLIWATTCIYSWQGSLGGPQTGCHFCQTRWSFGWCTSCLVSFEKIDHDVIWYLSSGLMCIQLCLGEVIEMGHINIQSCHVLVQIWHSQSDVWNQRWFWISRSWRTWAHLQLSCWSSHCWWWSWAPCRCFQPWVHSHHWWNSWYMPTSAMTFVHLGSLLACHLFRVCSTSWHCQCILLELSSHILGTGSCHWSHIWISIQQQLLSTSAFWWTS